MTSTVLEVGPPSQNPPCDHGVAFPHQLTADGTVPLPEVWELSSEKVREKYPRLHGTCPKGCGFKGIAYASHAHYIAGDW